MLVTPQWCQHLNKSDLVPWIFKVSIYVSWYISLPSMVNLIIFSFKTSTNSISTWFFPDFPWFPAIFPWFFPREFPPSAAAVASPWRWKRRSSSCQVRRRWRSSCSEACGKFWALKVSSTWGEAQWTLRDTMDISGESSESLQFSKMIYVGDIVLLDTITHGEWETWGRGWMTKASGVGERREEVSCGGTVIIVSRHCSSQRGRNNDICYMIYSNDIYIYMGEGAGGALSREKSRDVLGEPRNTC